MEIIFSCEVIDTEEDTFEIDLIKKYCLTNNFARIVYNKVEEGMIPIGSVEWCELFYGIKEPDYYPTFLNKWFGRNIFKSKYKKIKNKKLFIKPAEHYKQFNGQINQIDNGINDIIFDDSLESNIVVWCSDIVKFTDEWRYYILNGDILDSAWYDGEISDNDLIKGVKPPRPPDLPEELVNSLRNNHYYGVLDMGKIKDKEGLFLVESSHPYANGWYTESYQNYGDFLIESHKYLKGFKN